MDQPIDMDVRTTDDHPISQSESDTSNTHTRAYDKLVSDTNDYNSELGTVSKNLRFDDQVRTYAASSRPSELEQAYDQYSIQANSITIKLLSSSVYQLAGGFLIGFCIVSYTLYYVMKRIGVPDHTLFDFNTAAVTLLCLALINMMRLTLGGGRARIILLVCGAINTVFCMTYIIESLGITYAIQGSWGRRVQLQHYVEWLFSTPLIIILIGNLTTSAPERYKPSTSRGATVSTVEVLFTAPAVGRWNNGDTPDGCLPLRYVVYADVIMLITGAVCDIAPRPYNYIALTISFVAFFITLYGMDSYLKLPTLQMPVQVATDISDRDDVSDGGTSSDDERSTSALMPEFLKTRRNNIRVLNFMRAWVATTFALFPCVWMLAATHSISEHTELWLYFFSDLLAKVGLNAGLHALNSNAVEEAAALRERLLQLQLAEQIQHAAQTANENRNQFLRYLFHEIRGPLNAVVLGLRDIRSSNSSPDFVDTVGIMSDSLNRVSRLLDDANSLYRFDSGHFVLEESTFSMQQLLFRTLKMLQTQIVGRKANVRCRIDDTLPNIIADKYKIQQVIANLISNAIKFGPYRGRIVITVQIVRDINRQSLYERMQPMFNGKPLPVRSALNANDGFAITHTSGTDYNKNKHAVNSPPFTPELQQRTMTSPPTFNNRHVSEPVHTMKLSSRATHTITRYHNNKIDTNHPHISNSAEPITRTLRPNEYITVRLSVRDQGAGISDIDKSKLFQPYQHVASGTSQKGNSTGLGLVVSKRIIENLNGRLGVNSVVGVGSEFYFDIPCRVSDEQLSTDLSDDEEEDALDSGMPDTFMGYSTTRNNSSKQTLLGRVKFSGLHSAMESSANSSTSQSGSDTASSNNAQQTTTASNETDDNAPFSNNVSPQLQIDSLPVPRIRDSRESPQPGSNESTPSMQSRALSPSTLRRSDTSSIPDSMSNNQPLTAEMIQNRSTQNTDTGPKQYILIVDDVTSNRTLLSKLLTKQNYVCEQASNGQICVDMVLSAPHKYTAILLDHEMPVLSGSLASAQIRATGNNVPIIGVTGNTLIADQTAFIKAGADIILSKPVKLSKLLSAIRQYSAKKAAQTGSSSESTPGSTSQVLHTDTTSSPATSEATPRTTTNTDHMQLDAPALSSRQSSNVSDSMQRLQDITK